MNLVARAPLVPHIRIMRILWRMLAPLAVCANLVAWTWWLGGSEAIKQQALTLCAFILGFTLLGALVKEVLSPGRARLRVFPMADHRAERLTLIARGLLFILLGTELAIYLVRANGWSESLATLLRLLRTCGLVVFAWAAVSRSGLLARITPKAGESYRSLLARVLLRFVVPLAVLTLLFAIVSSALGYVSLAGWAVTNAVWSAVVVVAGMLVHRYLRRRLRGTINFMRDDGADGAEEAASAYIGLDRILAGALKLLVVGTAFFLVLSVWGLDLDSSGGFLGAPVFAGGEHTWGRFIFGLIEVALVVIAGAFVKNVLIFFVFPKADVELGARYAILTVLRYAVVVFAVLFALGSVGVDASTLAVFAGGATVGLAFGMKDIFSNFFSGMIMLLERPVRVGDSVAVAGIEGKIEAIRLRGTTIRTFEGTTVIIPNTQMIGERLTSLSYGLHTARMQVDVGVSYDADPRRVEQILLDVARADPRVLEDPAPFVRFNNFGESSLDFFLRCYTHEVADRHAIVSQLRVAVFEALRAADIEIPFPQRDLHVRSTDLGAAARPEAAPERPDRESWPVS